MCAAYDTSACCSATYTQLLAADPSNVYPGFTYNQCPTKKKLSSQCEAFHQYQECNYGCTSDPRVVSSYLQSGADSYYVPGTPGQFSGAFALPLCASYCDAWFNACADDFTCQTDWRNWPIVEINGVSTYPCPAGSAGECLTYRQRFTDARGLCNRIWNTTYVYSTNASTCVSLGGPGFPNLPNPVNLCPAKGGTSGFVYSRDGAIAGGVIGGVVLISGVALLIKCRMAGAASAALPK